MSSLRFGHIIILLLAAPSALGDHAHEKLPVIVNTWPFTDATEAGWRALTNTASRTRHLDAIVESCRSCEQSQCDLTVGFGGSPDEEAETTLDALIMDGETMNVGAVGSLRHCKEAIQTARRVLDTTKHSLLVGLQASEFAVEMRVPLDNLTTDKSHEIWKAWQKNRCQPNYRANVKPDPKSSCGPYTPRNSGSSAFEAASSWLHAGDHDTISVVAIDKDGRIAAGSSSNGVNHKVAGRVGDASIAGGGAYAERGVGGCASTGDGDLHLRFLPCFQVVESLRRGVSPKQAAEDAVKRILKYYPGYIGAVIAVDASGRHAAAAAGWTFTYAVRDESMKEVATFTVHSLSSVKVGISNSPARTV